MMMTGRVRSIAGLTNFNSKGSARQPAPARHVWPTFGPLSADPLLCDTSMLPTCSGVGDPNIWNTHDKAIKDQQKGLRDRLNEFNKNNCGDKVKIPDDAWEQATKPAPKPEQWKNPVAVPSTPAPAADSGFMKKMSELTGLTGTVLVIYVIVSEVSRLFPPRNLVPVP